jgi:hypothetical protein
VVGSWFGWLLERGERHKLCDGWCAARAQVHRCFEDIDKRASEEGSEGRELRGGVPLFGAKFGTAKSKNNAGGDVETHGPRRHGVSCTPLKKPQSFGFWVCIYFGFGFWAATVADLGLAGGVPRSCVYSSNTAVF